MDTTISIPDDLFAQARELATGRSLSELIIDAIRRRVQELKDERLAKDMEEGYRAEAERSSLDPVWMS